LGRKYSKKTLNREKGPMTSGRRRKDGDTQTVARLQAPSRAKLTTVEMKLRPFNADSFTGKCGVAGATDMESNFRYGSHHNGGSQGRGGGEETQTKRGIHHFCKRSVIRRVGKKKKKKQAQKQWGKRKPPQARIQNGGGGDAPNLQTDRSE